MCTIREILQRGDVPRDELIRKICYAQGYQRVSMKIARRVDGFIRAAVRRDVATNQGGEICLSAQSISDYKRSDLKIQFLAALSAQGTRYVKREKAARVLAQWMGFSIICPVIEDTVRSLINGLLRENRLEARGHEIRRF